jgi:hypothetical protein
MDGEEIVSLNESPKNGPFGVSYGYCSYIYSTSRALTPRGSRGISDFQFLENISLYLDASACPFMDIMFVFNVKKI